MRAWIGSQWRGLRRRETWSPLLALSTSFAAEFWPFCNFSRRCLGQPVRSELQQCNLERAKADTGVFVESTKKRWRMKLMRRRKISSTHRPVRVSHEQQTVMWMYLVFTRMPGESYRRWLRSLLLYLCDVFRALINSLVCWFWTVTWSPRTVSDWNLLPPAPDWLQSFQSRLDRSLPNLQPVPASARTRRQCV